MSNFLRGTNKSKYEDDIYFLKIVGTVASVITGAWIIKKIKKKKENKNK